MSADRLFTKCAFRLIPFMCLLYLVNFIDRTNAGFAALTMNADLGFSPSVYGFGAGVFFVGYALFQVPANLMLERIGAGRWMFSIMAAWGLLSASTAFVQSPVSFYVLRFFVGVAESGFFPGMLLYLTYWFPRPHLARFTGLFMISNPLSFVVGGPLSGALLGMDGVLGLWGWQWLFLIEGLPAFVLAFFVLKFLPDGPAHASWLSAAEKTAIAARLSGEEPEGRPDLRAALTDPRVLAIAIAYFALYASAFGIQLWLPQIVQAMGFSDRVTSWIVAGCFASAIPAMILGGLSSARRRERIWHVAIPWFLTAACLASAAITQSNAVLLAEFAFGLIGMYAAYGAIFSLPQAFLRGSAAAGGIALCGMSGNFGGFFGPYLVGLIKEETGGYAFAMAAIALGLLIGAILVILAGQSWPRAQ